MALNLPPITDEMTSDIWKQWFIELHREAKIKTQEAKIDDISTASTIYVPLSHTGRVAEIRTVIDGAISTADATLTAKNSSGTSMGTITITQSGSAAGDTDSLTSPTNVDVTKGDYMTIETNGSSTGTVACYITILFDIS